MLAGVLPTQFSLFLDCLYGLRDTVDSTFGFTLDPFYQDVISRFKVAFSKLREEFGVSESTKLHIIFTHLPQFIELTGSPWENSQSRSLKTPTQHLSTFGTGTGVKDTTNPTYIGNYLRAVLNFNANNI